MNDPMIDDDRLDLLILVRIGRGKKPVALAQILSSLRTRLDHALSADRAGQRIGDRIDHLLARGFLATPRGRATMFRVTESGAVAVRQQLAVARFPSWRAACDSLLPSLALGIAPAAADAQIATLLARRLGVADASTINAVADAVIARQLGLAGKVTLGRLRSHVLAQAGAGTGTDPAQLARRLAAGSVRAARPDAASIQAALVQRWLAGDALAASPPASPPASSASSSAAGADAPPLAELATAARAVAARSSDGRFGKKVFVAAVWRGLTADPRFADLSLDRCKQLLVAANRDGLLELTRADLVAAMDPALVAASEIDDLGSTFHFVTGDAGDGTGG